MNREFCCSLFADGIRPAASRFELSADEAHIPSVVEGIASASTAGDGLPRAG